MSRIGRLPIELPKGVTFNFSEADHQVTVKGPKGELKQRIDPDFKVTLERMVMLLCNVLPSRRDTKQCMVYIAHSLPIWLRV